jgi:molybdopterin-guanine dinucleotide biosynthesis protein A
MEGSRSGGDVTGAILAGGRARRLHGRNTATLRICGARIVDRQLAALRTVTAEQMIIAHDAVGFGDLDVAVVPDRIQGAGPLGGVFTALVAARCSRVVVLACDLPFVDAPFLRYLVECAPDADVVVPRTAEGLHPLCAVYSKRLAGVIGERLAAKRLAVHEIFPDVNAHFVDPSVVRGFDPEGWLLTNVNTQAEYEAVLRAHAGAHDAPPEAPGPNELDVTQ